MGTWSLRSTTLSSKPMQNTLRTSSLDLPISSVLNIPLTRTVRNNLYLISYITSIPNTDCGSNVYSVLSKFVTNYYSSHFILLVLHLSKLLSQHPNSQPVP